MLSFGRVCPFVHFFFSASSSNFSNQIIFFVSGFLESEDGFILKPLQDPPRGPRELQFYERVFNGIDPAPHVIKLKEFLPKYYGSFKHGEGNNLT